MCGIIFQSSRKRDLNPAKLQAALSRLKHRGPNDSDVWISPDKRRALGHTRLSITGIANGKQPLVSPDGSIISVVNGEFYDFEAIKQAFRRQSYVFTTESDSEIIIPLYLKYAHTLFEHLNGEFAFILHDQNEDTVFAARDRFGIKPLYYSLYQGELYMASEIKALLTLGVPAQWDEQSVASLTCGLPSPHQSCFRDIKQVQPGHYLIFKNNILTEKPYWDFKYAHTEQKSDEEYIEEFSHLLSEAVKRRLQTQSRYCFYLSGGIDSSAILALGSEYTNKIETYTIAFDNQYFDESCYSSSVANHYNANQNLLHLTQQDLADNYETAIYHHESICYQPNGVAKFLLSQRVHRDGYKVVLTGEGSDEILAGYPPFMQDFIHSKTELNQAHELLKLSKAYQFTTPGFISNAEQSSELDFLSSKIGYIPSQVKNSLRIERFYREFTKQSDHKHHSVVDMIHSLINQYPLLQEPKTHLLNKSCYLFSKTIFPSFVLSYLGDRAEMANSIEARLPFLDVNMVEFCNQLPISLKIRESREKFILYEALKGKVPAEIYARKKHPFSTPPTRRTTDTSLSPMYKLLQDIVHSEGFNDIPFLEQGKAIKFIDALTHENEHERSLADLCVNVMISSYFLQKNLMCTPSVNTQPLLNEVIL
jgi:asparagine synthase (glutamine-hydrolysing)